MSDKICEFPDRITPDDEIIEILGKAKTIAIVGLSDKPERPSYSVALYLKQNGYIIIPVNPSESEIMGEKCYPDLKSVPEAIDIVDIFRKIDAIPEIVNESIKLKPMAIWLQLGLTHNESAEKARSAGIGFIQSKCIKIEHNRLLKGYKRY